MVEEAKSNRLILRFVDVVTVLFMAVLLVMVSFQVLNRFILHIPAAWTEEMGRYVFVWVSLLGTIRALKDRAHLSVDILTMNLKGNSKVVADIIADSITLMFSLILTVTGYNYTIANIGNFCEFGEFPLFIIYLIIPITGLLLSYVSMEQIYCHIKGSKSQEEIKC